MTRAKAPEIISLSQEEAGQLLARLKELLPAELHQKLSLIIQTLIWLMGVVEEKTLSLDRLRRMIFGPKTEKLKEVCPQRPESPGLGSGHAPPKQKAKGHGRNGAKKYSGAREVEVVHPQYQSGQCCPECQQGKLHERQPERILRIVAQPMFAATCFALQRLRCALCGALFAAPTPPEAGSEKYDPSVGVMLAINRYGAGVPMYRMAKWQGYFGVPLPESTQWEQIERAVRSAQAVYQELIEVAAQARLLYHDDTPMRVQSLREQIARESGKKDRTGVFTTSLICQGQEHQVALFFTGRNHAGENLDEVLRRRAAGLPVPLQMCDALSRNHSKEFETILCSCIPHGRRNFVEVASHFPEQCQHVLEVLAEVYRIDGRAKKEHLDADQRLRLHQELSQPLMNELHQWMNDQLEHKLVEPNSGLGQALNYMINHWEPLTRFLEVPGAPLDNSICERALKMAILHRKNSLKYKTERGARVGDVFMSLIHTCALEGCNPFDYLMALQKNPAQVMKHPSAWLPWNYPRPPT